MIQKTKWMNYLRLGVCSFLLLFGLSSCQKDEFGEVEWIYINETEHEIFVGVRLYPFTLKPLKEYTFSSRVLFSKGVDDPSSYLSRYFSLMQGLIYDDVKCDTLKGVGANNIINYQTKKLGDKSYQYTYRFTEADYERAEDCE